MTTRPMVTSVAETHSSRLGHVTRFISEAMELNPVWSVRHRRAFSSARASELFSFFSAGLFFVSSDTLPPGPIMRLTLFLLPTFGRPLHAGRTGLEPATNGFGDRYSTN